MVDLENRFPSPDELTDYEREKLIFLTLLSDEGEKAWNGEIPINRELYREISHLVITVAPCLVIEFFEKRKAWGYNLEE